MGNDLVLSGVKPIAKGEMVWTYEDLEAVTLTPLLLEQLELSELQFFSLSNAISFERNFSTVPQELGLSDVQVKDWVANPFYVVCWQLKGEFSGEIDFTECLAAIQAGFLAGLGIGYPDIEKMLSMQRGTLSRWRSDEYMETDEGRAFRKASAVLEDLKTEAKLRQAIEEISPRKYQAITFIATGCTDSETAEALGIQRSTIVRWKNTEDFRAVLAYEKQRLKEDNYQMLLGFLRQSIAVISDCMNSSDENIRLKAASHVLSVLKSEVNELSELTKKRRDTSPTKLWN